MKDNQSTSNQSVRECDVFISYRRDGGDMTAMYFYQALKERGYNVFYDLEVLRAGKFNEALKLFQFLVLFDHLNKKYWMGLGAVQQVLKDFQGAIVSYGYSSFLDLKNPKPQFHAAECFLAMGDRRNAASALFALEEFCPKDTDIGREYRAKAAKLREQIGEDAFEGLAAEDAKLAKEKLAKKS